MIPASGARAGIPWAGVGEYCLRRKTEFTRLCHLFATPAVQHSIVLHRGVSVRLWCGRKEGCALYLPENQRLGRLIQYAWEPVKGREW